MTSRTQRVRLVGGAVFLAFSAGLACAQVAYEVSEDGQQVVSIAPVPAEGGGWSRGGQVLFSTEPDFEVNLRRQVGGLEIADMNNDGLNDLVAVCFHSQSFPPYDDYHDMIFYNTGSGIEPTPSWTSVEQVHTGDVQVGDLNDDGFLDIVTIHGGVSSQSVRVYYGGPGGPEIEAGWVSSTPIAVWGTAGELGDIDGDGDLDLVTSNQGISPDPYRPAFMFRNDGGVFTTAPVWMSADPAVQNGVAIGDINNDGFNDVVIAKWVDFQSGIYYNDNGSLNTSPGWTVGNTDADKGAAIADFDANGWLDVVFGGDPSRAFGQDDGTFSQVWHNTDPFSGTQDIRTEDVDRDGDLDIAEVHFSTGRTDIYLNREGVVDNDPDWVYDATNVGNALAFGDLNGDGYDDLAVGYSGDTSIRIFYATPPVCPADFNGDSELNFFDVQAFLQAFSDEDPAADFNYDSEFNFFDAQAFLQAFSNGCP